jgi:hypothetical protein
VQDSADNAEESRGAERANRRFPTIANYSEEGASEKEQDTSEGQMSDVVISETLIDVAVDSNHQHHGDDHTGNREVIEDLLTQAAWTRLPAFARG